MFDDDMTAITQQDRDRWNARLRGYQDEIERIKRERDKLALLWFHQLNATPMGNEWIRELLGSVSFDDIDDARRIEAARKAAGMDPEPGPAVRYADDDTFATEGRNSP